MVKDRFCLILSFLHLSNNQEQPARDNPAYDPVFKIRPFVDSLVNNFKSTFHPGKNVAIDEAMVAWRGPLSFRVYNPDKPDKFGMKVFELCDSASAYCSNLEFYTGKKEVSSHGATFDVVNRLIQPYLGCGRTLYVDNYYTSPRLIHTPQGQRHPSLRNNEGESEEWSTQGAGTQIEEGRCHCNKAH